MDASDTKYLGDYVLSLRQSGGGFSYVSTLPATLEDTYYALKLLEELKIPFSDKKTSEYAVRVSRVNGGSRENVYRLIYVLSRVSPTRLACWHGKLKMPLLEKGSADEVYYALLSKEIIGEEMCLSQKLKEEIASLGISKLKYVPEVARCVTLMKKTKTRFREEEYVRWLRDAQMPDGGYGFLQGSTSYLETTYYALRALKALNNAPGDLHECERFIRLCKCQKGYARQILARPSVESTYHAVSGLNIIEEMRRKE